MDTISVIIPIYNVEKYLDKCIRSVVGQTYPHLEIILVDDGSMARCGEICDEWARKDGRIRVIHKTNGGPGDARNAGLNIASGQYIGFVDSDDYIHPDMYRIMYEKIVQYNADIAVCGYEKADENGKPLGTGFCPVQNGTIDKYEALKNISTTVLNAVWNKLFKRKVFDDIRFPKKQYGEDLAVICRAAYNYNMISVSNCLYYYNVQSPLSITRGLPSVEKLDVIEIHNDVVLFFQKIGLLEGIPLITQEAIAYFYCFSGKIEIQTKAEKQRVQEVKKMVHCLYRKHASKIRKRYLLMGMAPRICRLLWRIKHALIRK